MPVGAPSDTEGAPRGNDQEVHDLVTAEGSGSGPRRGDWTTTTGLCTGRQEHWTSPGHRTPGPSGTPSPRWSGPSDVEGLYTPDCADRRGVDTGVE